MLYWMVLNHVMACKNTHTALRVEIILWYFIIVMLFKNTWLIGHKLIGGNIGFEKNNKKILLTLYKKYESFKCSYLF